MTQGPAKIDFSSRTHHATPAAWSKEISEAEVEVLPIVDGEQNSWPGWCSYSDVMDSPDIEVISGGINTKQPGAAAIWRQGHLLHFGFQPSPGELNETGRALLINSIVYIDRFTEDQALVQMPSPFAGGDDSAVAPGTDERLVGAKLASPEFLSQAIALLEDENKSNSVAEALRRRCPEGPDSADAQEWQQWLEATQAYLFYSQHGGARWYVDTLSLRRGVPGLSGSARADRKATPGS